MPPNLESMAADIPDLVDMLVDGSAIHYDRPNSDVKKVIEMLPRWYVLRRGKSGDTVGETSHAIEGRINAHAVLSAELMAASLRPWVEDLRMTYFGSKAPPFYDVKDIENWLAIYNNLLFLPKEQAERWRGVFKHDLISDELKAVDADGKLYELTHALWIWDEVENRVFLTSDKTGISPESLRYYLLGDIKPLQVPYEITMPGGEYCKGRRKCYYVNVRINTELGFDELLDIHRAVKDALGVKRGRRFDQQHLELYTMVQERGGVPAKGVKKFWESLLQEWDSRHPGMYKEWRSIRRAYDRLSTKLNTQYQIGGDQ